VRDMKSDKQAPGPDDHFEAETLVAECDRLGMMLPGAAADLLARHLDMVYEANEHTNLTRVPRDSAPMLHVADSLSGLAAMEDSPEGPWADIGSGAGFPGIPLAVLSRRHVDLIESVGKKAAVLSGISQELCLDVSVLACRAEEAAESRPGSWSAVAARAVAPLPALVELASPLLIQGGVLVCWKGALTGEEEARGARSARIVGMEHATTTRVLLPGGAERAIVVFRKTGSPSLQLPRRPGRAQRSPLA
jgi:16S rRNA (guanine527-N7)-methyltransferase